MKLWIDDIREIPDEYDIWAKTYEEAIEAFEKCTITHASFDHDLGMDVDEDAGFIVTATEDKNAKTGYDIAKWIEEKAFLGEIKPFTFFIHSANPIGAKKIEKALNNAVRFWRKNGV